MNVLTNVTATSLSTDNVAALLADLDGNGTAETAINDADAETALFGFDDAEQAYLVVSDGANTGIFHYLEADDADTVGGTAIAAAELTLLVTLTGVTDPSKLSVDNFTDFLA